MSGGGVGERRREREGRWAKARQRVSVGRAQCASEGEREGRWAETRLRVSAGRFSGRAMAGERVSQEEA